MANIHEIKRDFHKKKQEWAAKLKENTKMPSEPIGFDYELDPYGAPYYKKENSLEKENRLEEEAEK